MTTTGSSADGAATSSDTPVAVKLPAGATVTSVRAGVVHPALMGSEHARPRGRGDPFRAFGKREGLPEGEFGLRQVTGLVPGAPADGEASGTHHRVFGTGRAIRGDLSSLSEVAAEVVGPGADLQSG